MQKFVMFVNKNLKINMLKTQNIVKLGTVVIIKRNIGVLHIAYVIYICIYTHNIYNLLKVQITGNCFYTYEV